MEYVLYNSLTKNEQKEKILAKYQDENIYKMQDITTIDDYQTFFSKLSNDDVVTILGGDGTINHLINNYDGDFPCQVYLVPMGTGNDFFHDVVQDDTTEKVLLNDYLKDLPVVFVNGLEKKFINGVGFGIDGYCCEVGDELRAKGNKKVNYTSIAIKGLLFHFKAVNAKIIVDGTTYEYQNVWLAPTMKGRFYGGGMMVAPSQDRKSAEVSTVVYMGKSRIKTLISFPSIFKGEHIKKTKMVKVFTGHDIEVIFDCPTPLQIDGETVKNVLSYKVRA